MAKRVDIAIQSALSVKGFTGEGDYNPLDLLTMPADTPGTLDVHGAGGGEGFLASTSEADKTTPVTMEAHGFAHILCVHGACNMKLPAAMKVSRVEINRTPTGEMVITLHE